MNSEAPKDSLLPEGRDGLRGHLGKLVLSLRQHAIKPFLASLSLRVVRVLDLDPGKRIGAGLRLAVYFFQVLLT
jgi:hypothetical protein